MERVPEKSVAAENMYTEKYPFTFSIFARSGDRSGNGPSLRRPLYVIGVKETVEKQDLKGSFNSRGNPQQERIPESNQPAARRSFRGASTPEITSEHEPKVAGNSWKKQSLLFATIKLHRLVQHGVVSCGSYGLLYGNRK
ncbi:hypothetical protein K0M31_012983 [Melipona bicolor]|uniref:Uncharacterized protein n=1 Tax=Melipona bicolor TaxID=60889 RepID=A0AA40FIU2_9HYME|nr:hypothetical protein K0M31_012983 [Melipona bicolor]